MRAIHKFLLEPNTSSVYMPQGAAILHVHMQGGMPAIWALVDVDSKPYKLRHFHIAGTGQPIPEEIDELMTPLYIGTVHQEPFVWHVFEVSKP